ncbi:hypothetical protein B9Z19DRAFT_1069705 [Tuber borchii]|uniref:Uncharacterized protein n=1 Tax=Tuber borchii TaxID=42251 RepID=A0A2T6ZAM5_TUBBO|nr:hypothetical protein B9Z19DRAFT_1069705 [Tuber borchii]
MRFGSLRLASTLQTAKQRSTNTISSGGGEIAHLDPDPVFDNGASYEMQDKPRRSAPVPIVATLMEMSDPLMPDHAPPSIVTYSTTPATAPPAISPPPPRPTEFDYSRSQTQPCVKPL